MIINLFTRTIALSIAFLYHSSAAEPTWTLNFDLPEKKQEADFARFTPILKMESNSPNSIINDIIVEILPTSAYTTHAFGIYTTEDPSDKGGYKMHKLISVLFSPNKEEIISLMGAFLKEKFGPPDLWALSHEDRTYRWEPRVMNSRLYRSIMFLLKDYGKINMVFDELAGLGSLSEENRGILSKAYAEIEVCALR